MQASRQVVRHLGVVLFLGATRALAADEKPADTNAVWLAEHYTKYEHRIPMRDGVRLFTRVYLPKDDLQAWPIILTRTPYALKPYGADNYTDPSGSFRTLAKDNFIRWGTRMRFASEAGRPSGTSSAPTRLTTPTGRHGTSVHI